MPVIPCTFKVNHCLPCFDPPLLNLSAEAEDRNRFLAITYGNPTDNPISWWSANDCRDGVHWSVVSQEDAWRTASRVECPPRPPPPDGSPCSVPPCGGGAGDCEVPPCSPVTGNGFTTGASYRSAAQTCSLLCPNGDTFTHVLPEGWVTSVISQENADTLAAAICFKQADARKICFGFPMEPTCVGTFYEHIFTVTGGTPPYNIQISATSLPVGFSLNSGTGYFYGTGTTPGTYLLELSVTDSSSPPVVVHKNFTFRIVEITTPTPMPSGSIGTAYSEMLTSTPPGVGLWSVISGALPPGLTLVPTTGIISGTPTVTGLFNFRVALTLP